LGSGSIRAEVHSKAQPTHQPLAQCAVEAGDVGLKLKQVISDPQTWNRYAQWASRKMKPLEKTILLRPHQECPTIERITEEPVILRS